MELERNLSPPAAEVRPAVDVVDLATKINHHLQAGEEATRKGLEHYLEAGQMLLLVKVAVGKGNFGRWLKANFPQSDRRARQCMKLAREFKSVVTSEMTEDDWERLEDAWRRIQGNAPTRGDQVDVPPPEPTTQDPAVSTSCGATSAPTQTEEWIFCQVCGTDDDVTYECGQCRNVCCPDHSFKRKDGTFICAACKDGPVDATGTPAPAVNGKVESVPTGPSPLPGPSGNGTRNGAGVPGSAPEDAPPPPRLRLAHCRPGGHQGWKAWANSHRDELHRLSAEMNDIRNAAMGQRSLERLRDLSDRLAAEDRQLAKDVNALAREVAREKAKEEARAKS